MIVTVDLSNLTGPELEGWMLAFDSAAVRSSGDLAGALGALADAGHSERIRRTHGGLGPKPHRIVLVDPDADPAIAADVREDLITRVSAFRDAPWIGPRLAETLHHLLLALADERHRVRRESEAVRDLVASRHYRGSVPVTGND